MSNDITSSGLPTATAAVRPLPGTHLAAVARPQIPPAPEPIAQAQPDARETRQALEEASKHLNEQMSRNNRDLSFSVDSEAHKIVLTVKSRDSGEVLRQIPSEAALRVAHNLDHIKGLLQDKKT